MKYYHYAILILYFVHIDSFASTTEQIKTIHQQCYDLLDNYPDSAMLLAIKAESLAKNENDKILIVESLFIQAYIYRQKDDLGKSFVTNLKALDLLQDVDNTEALKTKASLLLNTGEILKQHHAYSESVKYYDEGIALAQQYEWPDLLNKLLNNKASALRNGDHLNEALATINQALSLALEAKSELRTLKNLNQKGLILKDMGQLEHARQVYDSMINYPYESVNPSYYLALAWHNTAVTYLSINDYTNAEKSYLNALKYAEPNTESQFISYMDLSEVYLNLGKISRADSLAKMCETIYENCPLLPDYYKFYDTWSKIAYAKNDAANMRLYADRYFEENAKFLELQQSIFETKDQYKMEVLTAGFFSERKNQQQLSVLQSVIWYISGVFFIILVITKAFQYAEKRALVREIKKIDESSAV